MADQRNNNAVTTALVAFGGAVFVGIGAILVQGCDRTLVGSCPPGQQPLSSWIYAVLPVIPIGLLAFFEMLFPAVQISDAYLRMNETAIRRLGQELKVRQYISTQGSKVMGIPMYFQLQDAYGAEAGYLECSGD